MRIGIDLDNTIICYDHVFARVARDMNIALPNEIQTKAEVKKSLRDIYGLDQGEFLWQKIQGQVYGSQIFLATPFDAIFDALEHFKQNNFELFIVSHKTIHGHFDESMINLHDVAISWLKQNDFLNYIDLENIYFRTTRDEKINKINELKVNYFIDDLTEILNHSNLNQSISKILFNPNHQKIDENFKFEHASSWQRIKEIILCR